MEKVIHYCWFGDKPLPKLAKKCLKSWKKYLPDYKIIRWSEENTDLNECAFIKGAYETKKWAFVADYARTKALNEMGGIYFDTDMELTKDISKLLEDKTFLGCEDTGYVNSAVWYEREPKSYLTEKLLEKYRSFKEFEPEKTTEFAIPILISEILKPLGLQKGGKEIQVLGDDIKVYPRDYFYPYSFHRDNNVFSENTCMIHYYDASWLPFRDRRDMWLARRFGIDGANKILRTLSRTKHIVLRILRIPLYPIVILRRIKKKRALITEEYLNRLNETINNIKENKDKDYIVFYNREWSGITSSSKELFENLVDVSDLFRKKDAKRVAIEVKNANIKQVVFSGFADGDFWLASYIKKYNKDIKIKTFWHGSNSQLLDDYDRRHVYQIIKLHKQGVINVMGTCKESLLDFYKSQGFNAFFISNKVSGIERPEHKKKNDEIRIGIYAAKCNNWRKNMYSQMAAVKLIDNAVIDMVPLNDEAKDFCNQYGIKIDGIENPIPREELLERMSHNDVNLYVTMSECAPMLPLESMELGVPCITGNNHHYFKDKEIEKYLVINNEVDVEAIKEKILLNIEQRDEVIRLYDEFSKENKQTSKKQVKEFLSL